MPMEIEPLSVENLREGVFCAQGRSHAQEVYGQLEAWLDGGTLRGRVARAMSREAAGFVLYHPIDTYPSDTEGHNLYMVQCVHVKTAFQNQGTGKALIEAAMQDAVDSGASGLAAEGYSSSSQKGPHVIPGAFLQRAGMQPVDSQGINTLYYMPSDSSVEPPRFAKRIPERTTQAKKIRIDVFDCSDCVVAKTNRDVVETVVAQLGEEKVELVTHEPGRRDAGTDARMANGVFVDGKLTFFRGPISEDDVWNAIEVARSAKEMSIDR